MWKDFVIGQAVATVSALISAGKLSPKTLGLVQELFKATRSVLAWNGVDVSKL